MLERIDSPLDLKKLSGGELKLLADDLRQIIIQTVSVNGGHLASNLGVIETTIALHYVFNTPKTDNLGCRPSVLQPQTSYRRKNRFSTIRKENGLSGFPKIEESEYDALWRWVTAQPPFQRHWESSKVVTRTGKSLRS